jgi:transposase InsO family protein
VRLRGQKAIWGRGTAMMLPDRPNQCRSLDFVSDALTDRRCFRILAVIDDFKRVNPMLGLTPRSLATASLVNRIRSSLNAVCQKQ